LKVLPVAPPPPHHRDPSRKPCHHRRGPGLRQPARTGQMQHAAAQRDRAGHGRVRRTGTARHQLQRGQRAVTAVLTLGELPVQSQVGANGTYFLSSAGTMFPLHRNVLVRQAACPPRRASQRRTGPAPDALSHGQRRETAGESPSWHRPAPSGMNAYGAKTTKTPY
jgi:hypothetical protein